MPADSSNIRKILREDILFEGLELAELGVSLDEITDETTIVGDDGLALDSVDALEIVSMLRRQFGIEVPEANGDFFAQHLSRFDRLVAYVEAHAAEKAPA
jgi:acyl carrier protein